MYFRFQIFQREEANGQAVAVDRFKFCNFRKYKSKVKVKIFTNKLHFLPQNAGGTQTKSLCTEGKLGEEGREGRGEEGEGRGH